MKRKIVLLLTSTALLLNGCVVEVTDADVSSDIALEESLETSTPKPTFELINTETPSPSPTTTVELSNSDLELITRPNHPVLFSSTDSAHEFWGDENGFLGWKDRSDKKISYPDTTTNSLGSGVDWSPCILAMDSDMSFGNCYNDYIFNIHICLNNFEIPVNLSLDEALEIASSYLPHDTLNTYYEYNYSSCYEPIDLSEHDDYYYEVSYSPIDDSSQDLILDNISYKFPLINITLRKSNDGGITDIWIDLHQSICRYGRNSIAYGGEYYESEWNCDLFSKQ